MGSAPTIERKDLYRAAWIAGDDVVVFQITSDKRVYVAPPARPSIMHAMSAYHREYHTGRILTSLLMLQLMFQYYRSENPPNATIVMKFVDDCFRDFSTSAIIERTNYYAMQPEQSSPWGEWIGRSEDTLPAETAESSGVEPSAQISSPLDGVAPVLFWHTSAKTEPSIDCHGLSMPLYDWLFTDASRRCCFCMDGWTLT